MKNHKDLDVWKMSMDFVEMVYTQSAMYPKEEVYGLITHLKGKI